MIALARKPRKQKVYAACVLVDLYLLSRAKFRHHINFALVENSISLKAKKMYFAASGNIL